MGFTSFLAYPSDSSWHECLTKSLSPFNKIWWSRDTAKTTRFLSWCEGPPNSLCAAGLALYLNPDFKRPFQGFFLIFVMKMKLNTFLVFQCNRYTKFFLLIMNFTTDLIIWHLFNSNKLYFIVIHWYKTALIQLMSHFFWNNLTFVAISLIFYVSRGLLITVAVNILV